MLKWKTPWELVENLQIKRLARLPGPKNYTPENEHLSPNKGTSSIRNASSNHPFLRGYVSFQGGNMFAPENGWLEDDPASKIGFWSLFRGYVM